MADIEFAPAETVVSGRTFVIEYQADREGAFVQMLDAEGNVLGTVCRITEEGIHRQPIPDTMGLAKEPGTGLPVVIDPAP